MAPPSMAKVIPLAETLVQFFHEDGDVQEATKPPGGGMGGYGGGFEKEQGSSQKLSL